MWMRFMTIWRSPGRIRAAALAGRCCCSSGKLTGIMAAASLIFIFGVCLSSRLRGEPTQSGGSSAFTSISLDGTWRARVEKSNDQFRLEQAVASGSWRRGVDVSGPDWRDIPVPKNWHEAFPELYPDPKLRYKMPYSLSDYPRFTYVAGWYRRSFRAPASWRGRRVFLAFRRVAWEAHVWVNGKEAGAHHGSFTPFECDITDALRWDADNQLALWVSGDFGERPMRHVYGAMFAASYAGGGIEGRVTLFTRPPIFVQRALVDPRPEDQRCDLTVWVVNSTGRSASVRLSVKWKEAGSRTFIGEHSLGVLDVAPGAHMIGRSMPAPVADLKPWTLDDPQLYDLALVLAEATPNPPNQDKRSAAAYHIRFGFRSFVAKDGRFFLNGQRLRLYMGNIWIAGQFNTEAPEGRDKFTRWVRRMKAMGVTAVRHHVAGTIAGELYDLADELGILVIAEWPWCSHIEGPIGDERAKREFIKNNNEEMEEWLYFNYNHPSVALWSLANEFWHGPGCTELLNAAYEHIRPMDTSGRPIVTCSGYPSIMRTVPLKTDCLDFHEYDAGSRSAPSLTREILNSDFDDLAHAYGDFSQPVTSFECLSLFPRRLPADIGLKRGEDAVTSLTLGQFVALARSGFGRDVGVRAMLDPRVGEPRLAEKRVKSVLEWFRLDTRWQGYQPWIELRYPAWRNWLPESIRPVYSPLTALAPNWMPNHFAGAPMKQNVTVIKDPLRPARLSLHAAVNGSDAQAVVETQEILTMAAEQEKAVAPIELPLPASLAAGRYTLELSLFENGRRWARNVYPLFVWPRSDVFRPLETSHRLAIFGPQSGGFSLVSLLDEEQVRYTHVNSLKDLDRFDVLILNTRLAGAGEATDLPALAQLVECGSLIRRWLQAGGRLLWLESAPPIDKLPHKTTSWSIPWLKNIDVLMGSELRADYVDLAQPGHPVFAGLRSEHFEGWNGGHHLLTHSATSPLTRNALAVVYTYGRQGTLTALFDARVGKGECVISHLSATERYGSDPTATLYLRNLLRYFLAEPISPLAKDLVEISENPLRARLRSARPELCRPVDMRGVVNRGFRDDGAGGLGWMGGGATDLRHIPLGKQTFLGLPFNIIDPQANNGKSCLILKGGHTPDFPAQAKIAVQRRVWRLFFLHAAYYMRAEPVIRYVVEYAGGTTRDITVVGGQGIGDWYAPLDLKECLVAWVGDHPMTGVPYGVYVMLWENPEPEKLIASIRVESLCRSTPILLALTAMELDDWAVQARGDAWDMNERWDIKEPYNLSEIAFAHGLFSCVSAHDPRWKDHCWFDLNTNGHEIDARHYKMVTFRAFAADAGTVQFHYFAPNGDWASSAHLPLNPGWHEYRVDLSSLGWRKGSWTPQCDGWGGAGREANRLRFDTYNVKGGFKLDWLRLTP